MTYIGQSTFSNCEALTSVSLENGLDSIGNSVFFGCMNLTSIKIPRSVTSIDGNITDGCMALKTIMVEKGNTKYDSRNNCNAIIETETTTLIAGCKNTTIPYSVSSIGERAFVGQNTMTSIVIPNGVTSICYSAFSGCTKLTTITIPNSVETIGGGAFNNTAWYKNQSDGLVYAGKVLYEYKGDMPEDTKIVVPDGVLGIAGGAFNNCTNLISITIPSSVVSVGGYKSSHFWGTYEKGYIRTTDISAVDAFSRCANLKAIFCLNEVPPLSCSFSMNANEGVVRVPKGSVEAYKEADGWKAYKDILKELIPGDANVDGVVNIADIVEVVNAVEGKPSERFLPYNADMDGNGIDVDDVNAIVDSIMQK